MIVVCNKRFAECFLSRRGHDWGSAYSIFLAFEGCLCDGSVRSTLPFNF
jgi:hypothetical protein